jgi:DNA polymerase elongation subunit (family B)
MHEEFIRRGKRFVPKKEFGNFGSVSYEGAYVKTPVPGLYGAVSVFDFASLYPTAQRQFNISPETYLGKFTPDENDNTKIVCASGAVFDATVDSCMRTVLARLFGMRKSVKDAGKE